ncbi:MAG: hypothetical protein R2787_06610 [Saprospiraceae bacterium]
MKNRLVRYWASTRQLLIDSWRSGLSPHQWGLAVAVSFLWGTMPMLGLVTALSFFSGWALRVSIPLVVGLTFAITPIQAAMVVPFIRMGARWYPMQDGFSLDLAGMVPWLEQIGVWQIQALGAWLTVMVPGSVALYVLVRFTFLVLDRIKSKRSLA